MGSTLRSPARERAVLAVVLQLLAACGDDGRDDEEDRDGGPDSGSQPDGGGAELTLEEFAREDAQSYCAFVEACFGPSSTAAFYGFANLPCEETTTRSELEYSLPRWEAMIAAGTLTYDPAAARACLDAVAADPCDEAVPDACFRALEGQVEEGGECESGYECVQGAFCDDSAGCPGQCEPQRAEGCACDRDSQCAGTLLCLDRACTALAVNGAACGGASAPPYCLAGLCVGNDGSTPGVCRPANEIARAGEGDACDPWDGPFCEAGLVCGRDDDVCVPIAEPGGTCVDAYPSACPAGQSCASGTCEPLAVAGEPCPRGTGCGPGTVCDVLAGRCVEVGELGAPCESDVACWSEQCSDGMCAAPVLCPDGEPPRPAPEPGTGTPVVTVESTCEIAIERLYPEECDDPAPNCPASPPPDAEAIWYVHYCSSASDEPPCLPVYGAVCGTSWSVQESIFEQDPCHGRVGISEAETADGSRELRWAAQALGGDGCAEVLGEVAGVLDAEEACCTRKLEILFPEADQRLVVEVSGDWFMPPAPECN